MAKPNVLLIMADDIGWFDIGAYHRGIMGTRTPNIDRLAGQGALFTDAYAQASCTAGAGRVRHRDEFYGNLYHLNAEEEPEQPDYPKELPVFQQMFMPRGVLDCKATDVDDPAEDPRFGRVGKQTITDTGPLTQERMRTIEDDLLAHSMDFIDRAHAVGKPFLLWHNTTRMHVWTRLSDRWKDKTGLGLYADGMAELDWVVANYSRSLTRWASRTTPSSSSPPITAPRSSPGPMAAPHRSAARRASAGRAASASRSSSAGPARSRPVRSSTAPSFRRRRTYDHGRRRSP